MLKGADGPASASPAIKPGFATLNPIPVLISRRALSLNLPTDASI
jgi:hypothetical protein